MPAPIALLTDFPPSDPFAGVMKGVIVSIYPGARIVDLAHGLPRHDVGAAALALLAAEEHFPRGTVFVAVVDPGVGGSRAVLAARSRGRVFLAADNGTLGFLKGRTPPAEVRAVRDRRLLWRDPPSRTFHGRDIFAPAAARLARGLPLAAMGPKVRAFAGAPFPAAHRRPRGALAGEVLGFDGFGNALTNLPATAAGSVAVGRRRVPVLGAYGEARRGSPLAVAGSAGLLEIAVREGSARAVLGLRTGAPVRYNPPR